MHPFCPRNRLRHSFISYRLALVKNPAEVSLECGNSPAMIFQHYRERVTPGQAEQWFAILAQNGHKKTPATSATRMNKGRNHS
jgi:hypothetical protein